MCRLARPRCRFRFRGISRPVWGIDAEIISTDTPMDADGPPDITNMWQLIILDDSDQADALGYHELTAAGLPLGKVFAGSDIADGASWQVTASHELLEMLIDPQINAVTEVDNADGTMTLYALSTSVTALICGSMSISSNSCEAVTCQDAPSR